MKSYYPRTLYAKHKVPKSFPNTKSPPYRSICCLYHQQTFIWFLRYLLRLLSVFVAENWPSVSLQTGTLFISGMVWVYNVQFSQDSTLVSNVKTYERYSCDPNMTRKHTHRNLFMILCKVGARILTYTSLHLSFFVFQTFGLSIATKNTLTTMSLYDITKKKHSYFPYY